MKARSSLEELDHSHDVKVKLDNIRPGVIGANDKGDWQVIQGMLAGEGDPTVLAALDGRMLAWNAGFEELAGKEFLVRDLNLLELVPGTVRATWNGWLLRLVNGESVGATRTSFCQSGAVEVPVEVSMVPVTLGEDRLLARIRIRDRSRETREEAARRVSDERFRVLCAQAPVGVFQTDARGRLTYTNDRWRRLAGLNHVTDPRGVWWQAVHPEDRPKVSELWNSALQHGHEFLAEFRFMMPRGQMRWGRTRISQQSGVDGRVEFCIGTSEDITDLKRIEIELGRARDAAMESVRLKTQFLSNISHEIRTPMNGVLGMLDLLLSSDLSLAQKGLVGIARESAEDLMKVMGDLLDFSRLEAGRISLSAVAFEPAVLLEGIRGQFRSRAEGQGLGFDCQLDVHVPRWLNGDPTRLHQVLVKLVDNGLKFTREGHVTVRILLLSADDRRCVLRFEVADSGPGIDPEALPRLFQPFVQLDGGTTRQHGGTGLGLALARQLVELMGGTIRVESSPGDGSTFWFHLTLYLPTA
jgi:PAS domain S-box-containing protein